MRLWASTGVAFDLGYTDMRRGFLGADLPALDDLAGGEPRRAQPTGIHALMLAVLEEAIRNYLGRDTRLRSDAAYWMAAQDRRSPFAFVIVCETLGFDPGAVRIALQRLRTQHISSREAAGRVRPNVCRGRRLLLSPHRTSTRRTKGIVSSS